MRTILLTLVLLGVTLAGCLGDSEPQSEQVTDNADIIQAPDMALPKETFTVSSSASYDQIRWRSGLGSFESATLNASFAEPGLYLLDLETVYNGTRTQVRDIIPVANHTKDLQFQHASTPEGEWFSMNMPGAMTAYTFGDGTISRQASVTHAYRNTGSYEVTAYALVNDTLYTGSKIIAATTVLNWTLSDVGQRGPEPSVGITKSGCMFFVALAKVMRNCDEGSWTDVKDQFSQPTTSDPWLWVDPITDRIFNVQMVSLACTWTAWSDDDGESWLGNPADCGPTPVNDHIKLATGPWRGPLAPMANNPAYETAVYFCYNKLVAVMCYTSLDGGATFTVGGVARQGAGLHGAITTAPDGTVYVPPRTLTPEVIVSKDSGLSWSRHVIGQNIGTPDQRKNAEVAVDAENNAYFFWTGGNNQMHLSTSTNGGTAWGPGQAIAPDVASTIWPAAAAGGAGQVAVAYIGSEDYGTGGWQMPDDNRWHLFLTYTHDALNETANWTTVKLSEDPVQIGTVCVSSGSCRDGNRNLLDFIDLTQGPDGRMYVAWADGCTGGCATDLFAGPGASRDARGNVAIVDLGFEAIYPS